MTDKLIKGFSPRNPNLNSDPFKILKQSMSGIQLSRFASNKQINIPASQLEIQMKSLIKSPKNGTIFAREPKTADNDLCKKLLQDNRQFGSKIKKLENTVAFLIQLLHQGETLYQKLSQKYEELKKIYLQQNEISMSFDEAEKYRKRLMILKTPPFPSLKEFTSQADPKPKTGGLEKMNQLLIKSQVKEVERSRIQQIEYTEFCKNCLNTRVRMSDDLNGILDVFDEKDEVVPPISKPLYKPENTKRIMLNRVDHQRESEDEKKQEDPMKKERQEYHFKTVDESVVTNSVELQKMREYLKSIKQQGK